ncbi:hypothetical protein PAHAL_3G469400 [Panicum hallii]|uniref:Uncharacterized protein n=1 Tax=Panicum hallii TaxID=206008 RepID=A0A2T8KLM5_9POAL|nr:hypothetical protein PAHAL_3G469400 [Panicum hallii]
MSLNIIRHAHGRVALISAGSCATGPAPCAAASPLPLPCVVLCVVVRALASSCELASRIPRP